MEKESSMRSLAVRGLFYIVAFALILWTSSLTYSFVSMALPAAAWYVPLFSLVVFDAGMLAWMLMFLNHAEGLPQRLIAICLTIFDFIGVALMTMADIFLGGQTLTDAPQGLGEIALWGIGVWTAVNVLALILYHLTEPEARQKMALQGERDAIMEEALKLLREQRREISGNVATTLGRNMLFSMLQQLSEDKNGDGIADILQDARQTAAKSLPQPARNLPHYEPAPAFGIGGGEPDPVQTMLTTATADDLRRRGDEAERFVLPGQQPPDGDGANFPPAR